MKKRRNLDRERLEVYLLYLLLAYRPFFRFSALLILLSALVAWSLSPIMSSIALGTAVLLAALSYSYQAALYAAKIGAWVGTIIK
jgi:hypothetical protein